MKYALLFALLAVACGTPQAPLGEQDDEAIALPPSCPGDPRPWISVTALGVDPTSPDVTVALNNAIVAATNMGRAAYLPAATYNISSALRLPSHATLVGVPERSIISASIEDGAWAINEPMVRISSVVDTRVCKLVLDHRGQLRSPANALAYTMIMSNTRDNRVAQVVFRGGGWAMSEDAGPSGPVLLMIARQDGDPSYDPLGHPGDVGPVEDNLIESSRFELAAPASVAFAIRMYTDFTQERDPAAFVHHVQRNIVRNNSFVGNYYWNTIELLGGGTVDNQVEGNQFDGLTLAHVDLDKGCSNNRVLGNDILRAGKPASLYRRWSGYYPLASAIADHGSSETYLNFHNTISDNSIEQLVEGTLAGDPDAYSHEEGAIYLQHTREALVSGNSVATVYGGTRGSAISLVSDIAGATIEANLLGFGPTVPLFGVRSGYNPGLITEVIIDDNWIEAQASAIIAGRATTACDPSGAQLVGFSGWRLYANRLFTRDLAAWGTVSIGLRAPLIVSNIVRGGVVSFFLDSPGAGVVSNDADASAQSSFLLFADTTLVDNMATSACYVVCPGSSVTESGNNFNCQ